MVNFLNCFKLLRPVRNYIDSKGNRLNILFNKNNMYNLSFT